MVKKIIVGISVLVLILFAVVAIQPATYSVQRSVSIKAPPEKIIPLISDVQRWSQWSPWGSSDLSGRLEVVSVTPAKVDVKLDSDAANAPTILMDFALEPQGDSTTVRWTLNGTSDFMGKMMNMFISMDRTIGPALDSGLAKMKAAAEK